MRRKLVQQPLKPTPPDALSQISALADVIENAVRRVSPSRHKKVVKALERVELELSVSHSESAMASLKLRDVINQHYRPSGDDNDD